MPSRHIALIQQQQQQRHNNSRKTAAAACGGQRSGGRSYPRLNAELLILNLPNPVWRLGQGWC